MIYYDYVSIYFTLGTGVPRIPYLLSFSPPLVVNMSNLTTKLSTYVSHDSFVYTSLGLSGPFPPFRD